MQRGPFRAASVAGLKAPRCTDLENAPGREIYLLRALCVLCVQRP